MLTNFGKLCREARTRMTMTRPEMAKLLGAEVKQVSDIETGKITPTAHYVSLVTMVLGLSVDEVEISLNLDGSPFKLSRANQPRYGA